MLCMRCLYPNSIADQGNHPARNIASVLVLPGAKDPPTCCDEDLVGLNVSNPIPSDLVSPVPSVGSGDGMMVRAAVPEAAVYKYGDLRSGKDHVGSTVQATDRPRVDPVAQSRCMEQPAKCQLWLSVPTSIGLH